MGSSEKFLEQQRERDKLEHERAKRQQRGTIEIDGIYVPVRSCCSCSECGSEKRRRQVEEHGKG